MAGNIQLDWPALVKEAITRRKTTRLTQKQLAVLAGVSGPTVTHFEKQNKNITLESAFKILRTLGLLNEVTNSEDI